MAKKTKKQGALSDLPIKIIDDGGYLHVDLAGSVEVEGCRSIIEYNSESLILNFGDKNVMIFGKSLEIKSFSTTSMTVAGGIKSIGFDARETAGKDD